MGCGELLSVPLVFLSLFSHENVPVLNTGTTDDDGKCELIGTFVNDSSHIRNVMSFFIIN